MQLTFDNLLEEESRLHISDAPFGLVDLFTHSAAHFKWPLRFDFDETGATVRLKNHALAVFSRRKFGDTRINVFTVKYMRHGTSKLLKGDICRNDGQIAHDFLGQCIAA